MENLKLIEKLHGSRERLIQGIEKVIIGQRDILEHLFLALLCQGHVLLTGVPGLAKTLIIKTLAEALDLSFSRIQFTPDLMPSDITGTEIIQETKSGGRTFKFFKGPIFAHIILADEINRTPPKTQAALLEAMQEHKVTAAGTSYALDEPFFVLATQNPIEQEGTIHCRKRSWTGSCSICVSSTLRGRMKSGLWRPPPVPPSVRRRKW